MERIVDAGVAERAGGHERLAKAVAKLDRGSLGSGRSSSSRGSDKDELGGWAADADSNAGDGADDGRPVAVLEG